LLFFSFFSLYNRINVIFLGVFVMVTTNPPSKKVVENSSFPIQGDHFTPRRQQDALTLANLAAKLRSQPLKRNEVLTFYISLRRRLGRAPTRTEINALARLGTCPSYETLKRWGVLKQAHEKRERSRSDTCFDCEEKKRIAMYLDDEIHWVCQKCYRRRTGKSQPKRGICPGCGNHRRISYRHPALGNVCWSCSPGKQLSKKAKSVA